eukprot:COSAG01_NODE_740_length_13891_cov_35.573013_16_plen_69_part_00
MKTERKDKASEILNNITNLKPQGVLNPDKLMSKGMAQIQEKLIGQNSSKFKKVVAQSEKMSALIKNKL